MCATPYPRFTDWKARLDSHVLAHLGQPFSWQDSNCCTFAAGWVLLATGRQLDVPAGATARATLRAAATIGGLPAHATLQFGEALPGLLAQPGDVVLLALPRARGRTAQAFGVCIGPVVAAQGAAGLLMVPITEAISAWRI